MRASEMVYARGCLSTHQSHRCPPPSLLPNWQPFLFSCFECLLGSNPYLFPPNLNMDGLSNAFSVLEIEAEDDQVDIFSPMLYQSLPIVQIHTQV
ncbi:uncharacterized protein [Euphorbia lathyris]|uniref:uncharacterized protein isoform X2 n=1 Tax=Euphorbia lathyris TaxID=212925 RepID=UPI0033140E84